MTEEDIRQPIPEDPPDRPAAGAGRPLVHRRRRWLPTLIWLVPIVVAVVGMMLVARYVTQRGPVITITFQTAEGIQAGVTRIKYKEVEIGSVEEVRLADDRSGVITKVQLHKEARGFTAADSRFWVVRPRAEVTGISGLGTLFSGTYIGADAGESSEQSDQFTGLEAPPIVTRDDTGRQFVLRAQDLGSLDIGSPVYYRRVKVGQVAAYNLDEDGQGVTLRIFVDAPYDRFVGANSRFWHASGFDMQVDASGFRLRTQSLVTVVLGGIAFQAPEEGAGPPAPENTEFALAADQASALATDDGPAQTLLMHFNQSLRGLAPGAPVDFRGVVLGEVKSIGVAFDPQAHEFRMPVLVQVFPDRLQRLGGSDSAAPDASAHAAPDGRGRLRNMIARGLHAQLRTGNLLTGQLYIALDFQPDPPAGPIPDRNPLEVPTISNSLDELQTQIGDIAVKLNKVPYEEIGRDLQQTLQSLNRTLSGAEQLVRSLRNDVSPEMLAAVKDIRRTLATAGRALESANGAMKSAERVVSPDSSLQQEFKQTLREIARSATSLRVLTDYLEQHPESILRGKPRDRE